MINAAAHLAEIYTLVCRSGLNKEYYGNVLHRTQRFNDLLEIAIAVGTAGSAISALTVWKVEPYGCRRQNSRSRCPESATRFCMCRSEWAR